MKKKHQKFLASVLSLAMLFTMAAPALATETEEAIGLITSESSSAGELGYTVRYYGYDASAYGEGIVTFEVHDADGALIWIEESTEMAGDFIWPYRDMSIMFNNGIIQNYTLGDYVSEYTFLGVPYDISFVLKSNDTIVEYGVPYTITLTVEAGDEVYTESMTSTPREGMEEGAMYTATYVTGSAETSSSLVVTTGQTQFFDLDGNRIGAITAEDPYFDHGLDSNYADPIDATYTDADGNSYTVSYADNDPVAYLYGQDANYYAKDFDFTIYNAQTGEVIDPADEGYFLYEKEADAVVYDNNTGLTWERTPTLEHFNLAGAQGYVDYLNEIAYGGITTWRIPSTTELYSISDFSGGWPFIDLDYFNMGTTADNEPDLSMYYDEFSSAYEGTATFGMQEDVNGDRIIITGTQGNLWLSDGTFLNKEGQFWSSDEYLVYELGNYDLARDMLAFGINHVTGHIKAYERYREGGNAAKKIRAVSGEPYAVNDFVSNGDGTVNDNGTGLMWTDHDLDVTVDWSSALELVNQMNEENYLGYSDWRLPNVKELQTLVDYSGVYPAIDEDYFTLYDNEDQNLNYYMWTSTSAYFGPEDYTSYFAWYVAFGLAPDPYGEDSHGAGAVRFAEKYEGSAGTSESNDNILNGVILVRDSGYGLTEEDQLEEVTRAHALLEIWEEVGSPEATIENPFTDISEGDEAYEAILWALEMGITTGTSATTFAPDTLLTCGQRATFLWRIAGAPQVEAENPFEDISTSDYFYTAALWFVEMGLGSADTFEPDSLYLR